MPSQYSKSPTVVPVNREQGGEHACDIDINQMVNIAAVSNGVSIDIGNGVFVDINRTVSFAHTILTSSSSSTDTLAIKPGSATGTQVRGIIISNDAAAAVRAQFLLGSTIIWRGGIDAGDDRDYNFIGGYPSATNTSIVLKIEGAGTVTGGVYYRNPLASTPVFAEGWDLFSPFGGFG